MLILINNGVSVRMMGVAKCSVGSPSARLPSRAALGAKVVGAVVVDGEHSEAGVVGRIALVLGQREARAFGQPSGAALTGDALAERFVGREPGVDVQWGGGATLAEEGEDGFHGQLLVGMPPSAPSCMAGVT